MRGEVKYIIPLPLESPLMKKREGGGIIVN